MSKLLNCKSVVCGVVMRDFEDGMHTVCLAVLILYLAVHFPPLTMNVKHLTVGHASGIAAFSVVPLPWHLSPVLPETGKEAAIH